MANIIAHREYLSPAPAVITIYNDKVEFKNPNNPKFFGKIDPDNFAPFSKNPVISKLMLLMGLAEEVGSGIFNVKKYLPFYDQNATYEFIDDDFFSTVIYFNPYVKGEKVGEKVGENEKKILSAIEKDKYITYKKLSAILKISEKSIFKNIEKLKQKGMLKRIGPDRGGYWQIIK